jgi:hypothetical protein
MIIQLIPLFEDHSHPLVNLELKKALACPECGAGWKSLTAMTENRIYNPRYVITCGECKFIGPYGRGLQQAVIRWNKPPSFLSTTIKRLNKRQNRHFHKPIHT